MSLQLILGSSGSGKSYELYKRIIHASISNPSSNYILIVPEQFNMQAQKDIISMHPNKGVMNIDIVSFTRLAFRVFEEIGGYDKIVLEDTGKSMVLRKVVELKKKDLGLFAGNIKRVGFINELKSLLSELYQYNIDDKKLEEALKITDKKPLLNSKLKDILTVYNGFKDFISDKFITTEEILDILSSSLNKSNVIKNSILYLDGFTGFTPSQYKLLKELMKYTQNTKIALTIDSKEYLNKSNEEYKLFNMTQKTIVKLIEIASEAGIKYEKDLILEDDTPIRFKESEALSSLEKNLFRYPYKSYDKKQDNISIHLARNPNDEVEFITREILKLVREKNYRYKDIAVVTGDIECYSNIIDRIFDKNNIPCFTDNKRSILSNPFVELIRSVIEVIVKDFSYESIFRYLRCGLTGTVREDIDMIENYVLALGIRGSKRWQSEWKRKYRGSKELDFEKINTIRQNIIDLILPLQVVLKNKECTVKMYTTALWEFIVSLNVEKQLEDYKIKFTENKELTLTKQYEQIYKIVLDLFDKIVELLGDEVIKLQEYSSILDAGFEEAKMGLIPPSIDQIVIGDIERTRLKDIKALFFVGVNDGIIPKVNNGGGIISDIDKQILSDNGIELAPTSRQNAYTEKFYLYLNLTKPKEKLYICFSKVGLDGKSLRASYLVGTITKLFTQIAIIDEELADPIDLISTRNTGIKYLLDGIREYKNIEMTNQWKELYNWYYNNNEWKEKILKFIDAAFYTNKEKGLSKAVATALYGKELSNSVTRLEQYAGCAYAHFLSYGLELTEREKYLFSAPDMGNIFHSVIELFSKKLYQQQEDWNTISDEARDKLTSDCVEEITHEYGDKILNDSARNEYMINRVERISKRTIWALQQQLKKGSFTPNSYEIEFSSIKDLNSINMEDLKSINMEDLNSINITLSEDEKIKLKGRIDRLDKYEDKENIYVKIIDYKSGVTSFDIVALYYGLQLQLVVYMNAAIELEKKNNQNKHVVPAGIFYYNINDPVVDKKISTTPEKINEMILNELKMNGLVNTNEEIVKLLDRDFNGKSAVIPLQCTKDGKMSSAASEEQFNSLSKYVHKKIVDFGREILDGNIEINPYKMDKKSACTYCNYNAVCGFEAQLEGNNYRKLRKYSETDIWELIEEDGGEN